MPSTLTSNSSEYTRPNSAEFWVAACIISSAASSKPDSTASGTMPAR